MPDTQLKMEDNIDRLDGRVFHDLLVDLVDEIARGGAEIMRELVPKGETRRLEEHVSHTPAVDAGAIVTAEVGVSPIEGEPFLHARADLRDRFVPGEQDRSNYPRFVDRGTGDYGPSHSPIFARRASTMAWEEHGHTIFRREVRGQPGQHFVLQTYSRMLALLPELAQVFRARAAERTAPRPL